MEDSGEIIGKREEMRVLLNYSTTKLLYYSTILLKTEN